MKTLARSPQRGRLLAAVAAVSATLSFAVAAAPASAAPVTYSASGGRTVEFSAKKFTAALPGTQRLTVKGTGWVGASPSSDSQPVVAFKLDNLDTLAGWGGDDRYVLPASPTTVAFKADNDTGNFTGWIDLPANLAKVGPGTGPNAGQHWLRILAGAFSTPGSTPNPAAASNVFGYIDAVDAPLTGFQGDDFFPGTFIPAGGATSLKVSGNLDTTVAGPVAVSFDGTTIANARNFGTQSALTTNANGDFTAAVPVPGGTTGGVKILSFTAGGTTQSVAITVTPRTAARQTPQTASVGDTVTVNGTGFRKIDGAGQKVGLLMMPGDVLLGCGTADAEGAVSVSGAIPAGTDLGDKSLWLAFGAACVARGPVVEPAAGLVQLTGAAGISVVVKPDPTPTPTP
ncbi:MAG: hypothetical protein Q7T55_25365, partial [Solirubrobacteraceae bacterium]|nr:hypothetical protein [Solirubrobacteraceae bacterium]